MLVKFSSLIQTEGMYHFKCYVDKLSVCDEYYDHRICISLCHVVVSFRMLKIKVRVADIQTTHSLKIDT